MTGLTAATVTGTFSNSTIAINSTEHFNVSYTSTGAVLTVASGPIALPGGVSPSAFAVVPKQATAITSLRNRVGVMPRGGSYFVVAGMRDNRARSGVILAGPYSLSKQQNPTHLPVQLTARSYREVPVMPSTVAAAARGLLGGQRTTPSVSQVGNWNAPARSVSTPRSPVMATTSMRPVPARISPPMLPRLGR